jgi:glycosyltransferase involved in cell wall biosynthesis
LKKKNILLLIHQLYGGGAEKVISNLSIHLPEYYNVNVAIYNNINETGFTYGGNLIKIKLPYSSNPATNPFHKRFIRFVVLINQLRKIKRKYSIDVCVSFLEASNFVNILSRRKEKVIISVRSFLSHEFKDDRRLTIFHPLIKMLYKRADRIVVPAELLKHELNRNFGIQEEKVYVIYNFVDRDRINFLANEPIPGLHEKIFNTGPMLINVGRLSNAKAQWLLISVLKRVKQFLPATRLVILGEGNTRTKLLDTAEKEGLRVFQENTNSKSSADEFDVYLIGHQNNPYPYLKRSTLFIMSSVYEGFPNVIIESMACGLPVLASDCPTGPREILDPPTKEYIPAKTVELAEYGVLVPAFVPEKSNSEEYIDAAQNAVRHILNNQEARQYYRMQSAKRVKDFEKETIIKRWLHVIG